MMSDDFGPYWLPPLLESDVIYGWPLGFLPGPRKALNSDGLSVSNHNTQSLFYTIHVYVGYLSILYFWNPQGFSWIKHQVKSKAKRACKAACNNLLSFPRWRDKFSLSKSMSRQKCRQGFDALMTTTLPAGGAYSIVIGRQTVFFFQKPKDVL